METRRMLHMNTCCAILPPLVGPAGLITWQEGYEALGTLLLMLFAAMVGAGITTTRMYWTLDRRAARVAADIARDGYYVEGQR